jgi:hypothetical protein
MHNSLAVSILPFQPRTGYSDTLSLIYSVSIGQYAAALVSCTPFCVSQQWHPTHSEIVGQVSGHLEPGTWFSDANSLH